MTKGRLFGGTIKSALVHAATQYDIRQSRKWGYNPYALGQYLMRIDEVCNDIERGAPPREALLRAFSDRLLDTLLRAIGEPKHEKAEKHSRIYYGPVKR